MLKTYDIKKIGNNYLFLSISLLFFGSICTIILTADSEFVKILAMTILSAGLVGLMVLLWGFKDPLIIIVLCYYYFSFGPILNYLIGNSIYIGIIKARIFEASIIFSLSLFTILVSGTIFRSKINLSSVNSDIANVVKDTNYSYISLVMIVLIVFTGYLLLTNFQNYHLLKNHKIAAVGPSIHYNYLLIQSYVLSIYFFIRHRRNNKIVYFLNFIVYIAYCLFFSERDFVFVIVPIAWYSYLFNNTIGNISRKLSLAIMIIAFIYLSTFIFKFRALDRSAVSMADVLNQGSLLFINTRIIEIVDTNKIMMYGSTYINSLMNLLPSWIYHTEFNLPSWFKTLYAPRGLSGYGFALDAEAYLNFKFFGIPPLFMMIVCLFRFTFNRIIKNGFYLYINLFYAITLSYSIRNDSLTLLKGTLYAGVFYWMIYLVGKTIRKTQRSTVTFGNRQRYFSRIKVT